MISKKSKKMNKGNKNMFGGFSDDFQGVFAIAVMVLLIAIIIIILYKKFVAMEQNADISEDTCNLNLNLLNEEAFKKFSVPQISVNYSPYLEWFRNVLTMFIFDKKLREKISYLSENQIHYIINKIDDIVDRNIIPENFDKIEINHSEIIKQIKELLKPKE